MGHWAGDSTEEIMEIPIWVLILTGVALFLSALAKETDEDTPIIGKYHGLLAPIARALLSVLRRK